MDPKKQTPKSLEQIEEDIKKEIRKLIPLRHDPISRAFLYLKITILRIKRLFAK